MNCDKCNKEFDYKPNIIHDFGNYLKELKVCDECEDIYQEAIYLAEFSE